MRVLAALACENIIEEKRGPHSLITVINEVIVERTPEMPANAVLPREWWIYVLWDGQAGEVGRRFTERVQVFWPNGELVSESNLPVVFAGPRRLSVSHRIVGLPVGQAGDVRLHLSMTPEDGGEPIHFDTSFLVTHAPSANSV